MKMTEALCDNLKKEKWKLPKCVGVLTSGSKLNWNIFFKGHSFLPNFTATGTNGSVTTTGILLIGLALSKEPKCHSG